METGCRCLSVSKKLEMFVFTDDQGFVPPSKSCSEINSNQTKQKIADSVCFMVVSVNPMPLDPIQVR